VPSLFLLAICPFWFFMTFSVVYGGNARSSWDDAGMSANTGRRRDRSATDDEEEPEQRAPLVDHRRPPTNQMRTVGQRRRDSEEKLEHHQREARSKPKDETAAGQ